MTVTTETRIPELTLGDRLRITRDKAGISRDEMGKHFGTKAGAIGHWETDRSMPRDMLGMVKRWAEITGYDAHWIAFGSDSTSNNTCLDGSELAFSSQMELDFPSPTARAHAA